MIVSPICDMLGIRYPIFQGAMAWIADGTLAAAVSNGGGLGIIASMNADADYLRQEIRSARAQTDRPFGVNVMLLSPYVDQVAAVLAEEKVPVVTTGAGNPAKYMKQWLAAGIRVIPVVPSVAMARLVERAGASAVIAEGGESGGHVGELTTMALVPQVCDSIRLPVLAAGGIADGRGVAAAFMLGACGVQLGTRFLVAQECRVHRTYKDKILKAKDIDTITVGKRMGRPIRCLKNQFARDYVKMEYDGAPDDALRKQYAGAFRLAAMEGDVTHGCFMAGQIASMVKKEQPAAEIIRELFEEAETILNGAGKWVK